MGKCIMCPHCESWFFPEKGVSLDDCPKCGRTVEVPPDHIADANKKVQPAPAPLLDEETFTPVFDAVQLMHREGFSDAADAIQKYISDLTRRLAEAEKELARTKDKLACSTCFYRPTKQEPCRYQSECCYSTGVGHTEGKNCWESNTPLELLTGEDENGAD